MMMMMGHIQVDILTAGIRVRQQQAHHSTPPTQNLLALLQDIILLKLTTNMAVKTQTYQVEEYPIIVITSNVTELSCPDSQDAKIEIEASGGNAVLLITRIHGLKMVIHFP